MAVGGTGGVGERARLAFFRSFISLLVAAIAVSEWAVLARLLARVVGPPPRLAHVLGPVAFWLLNRAIVRRRPSGAWRPFVRAYVRVAFTSVFCGVFLALATLVGLA